VYNGDVGTIATAFTVPAGPDSPNNEILCFGGANIKPIQDFCGGFAVSAINVHTRWVPKASEQVWRPVLPSTEQTPPNPMHAAALLGDDMMVRAIAAYKDVPIPGPYTLRNLAHKAAMSMTLASIGTHLLMLSDQYGRSVLSAWDTRGGMTVGYIRWIKQVLESGVLYPASYAYYQFKHATSERIRGDHNRHYCRPKRIVSSMGIYNPNSGNRVYPYRLETTRTSLNGSVNDCAVRINECTAYPAFLKEYVDGHLFDTHFFSPFYPQ
jgi:hypothetical protein